MGNSDNMNGYVDQLEQIMLDEYKKVAATKSDMNFLEEYLENKNAKKTLTRIVELEEYLVSNRTKIENLRKKLAKSKLELRNIKRATRLNLNMTKQEFLAKKREIMLSENFEDNRNKAMTALGQFLIDMPENFSSYKKVIKKIASLNQINKTEKLSMIDLAEMPRKPAKNEPDYKFYQIYDTPIKYDTDTKVSASASYGGLKKYWEDHPEEHTAYLKNFGSIVAKRVDYSKLEK